MIDEPVTYTIQEYDFTWKSQDRTFLIEASDLDIMLDPPYTIQLYNEKTGKYRNFQFQQQVRNDEGEIECWNYQCVTDNNQFLYLIIFND